ncbi:MAG: AAA family ATPase [Desulfobacteraceae bacterium]|nr:AAA family ATPase [Desulfobacteraceae bacterium]
MLKINKMTEMERKQALSACSYLFSPEKAKNINFIKELNSAELKKAFREKAKRYHPDLHVHEKSKMVLKRQKRFIIIQDSYNLLKNYIIDTNRPVKKRKSIEKKIIAIGGAKGGVGKSLFAANLSVVLSSMGLKTVVADLDLGGANMHLYLGITYLKNSINNYLRKQYDSIDDIMTSTKYGPVLIGGDSSQLGTSNIHFTQKLKLLNAIKSIKADCIILDLGGDTSYNMLDFFLAADAGVVMTTCEPASYLDAYNFIKVAIYRKLNRIFGSEFNNEFEANPELKKIIKHATSSSHNTSVKNINELLDSLRTQQPQSVSFISDILNKFSPHLIINRITSGTNIKPYSDRIRNVSKKMLTIDVNHTGSINYCPEFENSVKGLIPYSVKYPNSELTNNIRQIANILLK